MRKKVLSALLCTSLLLTGGMMAGCGEKEENGGSTAQSSEASDGSQAQSTDPAELSGEFTYWTYTDSANNLVKAFNEKYPNIKVNLQVFGGDEYRTKILTALQSGTDVPDVFDLEENYMYEFLDSDLLADLSYIDVETLTKDYYDFQKAEMKDSKGNIKCLTFQSSPVVFWYLKDACEQWLGTSDPAEISAMLTDWDAVRAKGEEVYEASGGTVHLWPNITEMVKVDAFSFDPLVKEQKLNISDDWMGLLDEMRTMYGSKANAELNSWSSEWAAAWNDGTLLFRVMPSWDYFTDWDTNTGNVGVAVPFKASYEGATGICVYEKSEKKDLAAVFLEYIASDEFQTLNLTEYNQFPASKKAAEDAKEGYTSEQFGGQNIIETYSEVCANIKPITPDKYTRATQNDFQQVATDGIKAGQDNDTIIEEFEKKLHDKYPEVTIE